MLNFKPNSFTLNPSWGNILGLNISIEYRLSKNHEDYYCIKINGNVMHENGDLEYEGLPSSRTEDFIQSTRFNLPKALELANKHVPKIIKDYCSRPNIAKFLEEHKQEDWALELSKIIQ